MNNNKEKHVLDQAIDPNFKIPIEILSEIEILDNINDIKKIDNLKKLIETKLDFFNNYLISKNLNMNSILITNDGFPRSDIDDILQVTQVRKNIRMLQNDLKKVIDRSYILLNEHFNSSNNNNNNNIPIVSKSNSNSNIKKNSTIPFATIIEVIPNGPMALAGIKLNDKIISIGNINATNHQNLKGLQSEVINNKNKKLQLTIERITTTKEILNLDVIPTDNWPGQGILGCRLQQL